MEDDGEGTAHREEEAEGPTFSIAEEVSDVVKRAVYESTVGSTFRVMMREEQIDEETEDYVVEPMGASRQDKRRIDRQNGKRKVRMVEIGAHLVGKQVRLPDGSYYTVTEEDMEVVDRPMGEVIEKWEKDARELARLRSNKHADDKPKTVRELIMDKIKHLEMLMNLQKETSLLSRLEAAYQGATVMEPKCGFHYLLPVICVDFASLYPSIMMAYNISPDSKLFESDFERFKDSVTRDMCWEVPELKGRNVLTGRMEKYFFIKKEYYEGLLPLMEVNLLAARKVANNEKAFYDESIEINGVWQPNPNYDPIKRAVFDGRQLQLKIICNSGYGAMGATGLVGDKDCAAAVTVWGRIAIKLVRDILIERYNAVCEGGDTDSVFMTFPGFAPGTVLKEGQKDVRIETVAQAEAFSDELEAFINSYFRAPMRIAYEKAMFPLLITGKKRYCGIIHEKGKKGRFFSKGMETVRRDSLPVTRDAMMKVFGTIMIVKKETESLEEYEREVKRRKLDCIKIIQDACIKMLKGDVPISDLVMSKQISREEYASRNQAHLVVADRMAERGEDPPKLGERVPYIYLIMHNKEGSHKKERKGYEMAEHPDYAVRNSMLINYAHYVDKKMVKPVLRVMKHLLRDMAIENIVARHRQSRIVREERVDEESGEAKVFFVTKVSRGITESQITSAMIEEEVEQILFQTAPKGSQERKNIQTKYMRRHPEMKNRVIYKPKAIIPSEADRVREAAVFSDRTHEVKREKRVTQEGKVVTTILFEKETVEKKVQQAFKLTNIAEFAHTSTQESRLVDVLKKHGLPQLTRDEEENQRSLLQGLAKEKDALREAKAYAASCLKTCQDCVKQERVLCNAYDCVSYFPRVASKGAADSLEEQVLQLEIDIENIHLLAPPPLPPAPKEKKETPASSVKIHRKRKTPGATEKKKAPVAKKQKKNAGLRPISSFFPTAARLDMSGLINEIAFAIENADLNELRKLLKEAESFKPESERKRLYEGLAFRIGVAMKTLRDNIDDGSVIIDDGTVAEITRLLGQQYSQLE